MMTEILTTMRNNPITTEIPLLMCPIDIPDANLCMCGKFFCGHQFLPAQYASPFATWHC